MQTSLISLIDILDSNIISKTGVIEWGSPVPSFGNISNSWVATLGLNPSNREFIDDTGNELKGGKRRFQTLSSLRLKSWSEIDSSDLYLITESCNNYFQNNPYDRWFKVLDLIISGIDSSFYSQYSSACHLDLIPFATKQKWNYLSKDQKTSLLEISSHTLGSLICESPIKLLILNGQSVIDNFQLLAQIQLEKEKKTEWSLPRHTSNDVQGIAYHGVINNISGIPLNRDILVLGFNHNLQSSYGITSKVLLEIQKWVRLSTKEFTI